MNLNQKQNEAVKLIQSGENVYISGQGGVGKSYLLNYIKTKYENDTIFMAPTGIAALNIGASTIHSVFGFPFHVLSKRDHSRIKDKTRELFDRDGPVNRIVIDEISMVRLDVFKAIDQQLRKIRRLNIPFGGVQVIVVGDFYQLPPVVTNQEKDYYNSLYDSEFCFADDTWAGAAFNWIELDEVMRQSDKEFVGHLVNIRKKTKDFSDSLEFFNQIGLSNQEKVLDDDPVFLCTTNKVVNAINYENYKDLDGKEHLFHGRKTGKMQTIPAPENLYLKYGTKVMTVANTEHYVNGEVGYVIDFIGVDKVLVLMESDEREVLVEPFKWEEMEYGVSTSNEVQPYPVGSYKQLPLKHAWAITGHKSQGTTLEHVMIDRGNGTWANGQMYLMLSRVKTLDGLALTKPILQRDIIVSDEVREFYDNECRGIGLV